MSQLSVAQFDFELPPERIAQHPLEHRDRSRLMVLRRSTGAVSDHVFADVSGLLDPGDLLVVNNTRVIPARFQSHRASGGRIEGLFLRELQHGLWEVMLRGAGRCRIGQVLSLEGAAPAVGLTLRENLGEGRWLVATTVDRSAVEILEQAGTTPLPPYIHRQESSEEFTDRSRYQTIYSSAPGAVAAPTAGLHFTPRLMEQLSQRGIACAAVTLHVGMGTFLPVKVDQVGQHKMHAEWFDLPADTAAAINAARRDGRRVVAVGTTSMRVLETAGRMRQSPDAPFTPATGQTDIFIYPPAQFGAADAMITNFHLPRSTLLMLVSAFCSPGDTGGIAMIQNAYRQAIDRSYRFYSYGDAMLIL